MGWRSSRSRRGLSVRARATGHIHRYTRLLLAFAIAAASSVATLPADAVPDRTIRDEFTNVAFDNSDGGPGWLGPWIESGESDGPSSGTVQVVAAVAGHCSSGACLRVGGSSVNNASVNRGIDLSEAIRARLSFAWSIDATYGYWAQRVAPTVDISADNGTTWTTLHSFPEGRQGPVGQLAHYDISPWIGGAVHLRISTNNAPEVVGYIYVDDVEVEVDLNEPPSAGDDDATSDGTPVSIDTLRNDHDPELGPLLIASVERPRHGGATIVDGTAILYEPTPGFEGEDTFTYRVTDEHGGMSDATVTVSRTSSRTPTSETSTVTSTVTSTADSTTGASVTTSQPTSDQIEQTPTIHRTTVGVAVEKLRLPLIFEVNEGQADPSVDFVGRSGNVSLALDGGTAVLALDNGNSGFAIRMVPIGGDSSAEPVALDATPTVINYFRGSDPALWQRRVATYSVVEYREIYPGIDVRYYGSNRTLEYDFIVHPGADPSDIELAYAGATVVRLAPDGSLELGLNGGRTIAFSAPLSYQEIDGFRHLVSSRYLLDGDHVRFEAGSYDPTLPLIIDPTLDVATYLGGSGSDFGDAVGVDSANNIIAVGRTASSVYPTTIGAYDTSANPGSDIVVSKISADGTTLLWSTYLGGSGNDDPDAVLVDGSNRIVVVGSTNSSNYPTTAGAYDTSANGMYDGFVTRLNADGASLSFSTYIGGTGEDVLTAVDLDPIGNVVAGGYTLSSNFPTTAGAYDQTKSGAMDGVVTKFSSSGASTLWSTFLGSSQGDSVRGLDVDSSGGVHVIGHTVSPGFPPPPARYDTTHAGDTDVFYAEVSSNGASLAYSTFIGGSGLDYGFAVVAESTSDIFLAGDTESSGFPTTPGAYDTSHNGGSDGWIAKFDRTQAGSATLEWSSFIGGSGSEFIETMAIDSYGRPNGALQVGSSGLATVGAPDSSLSGSADAMLATLSADGSRIEFATYIGGSGVEDSWALVIDTADRPVLIGDTSSSDFTTTPAAYDTTLGGTGDIFIVRYTALGAPFSNTIVAANADSETTSRDVGLILKPTANDSDPDSDVMTEVDLTDPPNGTVAFNGDGTVTYAPDPGYVGPDGFDYWAIDAGCDTRPLLGSGRRRGRRHR